MAELSKAQRKELAQTLYTRNQYTQKEVAKLVGVSEVTMSKWVNEGKWNAIKMSLTVSRQERISDTILQLGELDNAIKSRPEGQRYPTSKEADTRRKLTADLEALEKDMGATEIFNVSTAMLTWLNKFNPEEAKRISGYFDAFIKDTVK